MSITKLLKCILKQSELYRNTQKANAAAEEVRKASGNKNVHPYAADLSSMAEVRRLADEVKQSHPNIDVLSNNAGVFAERLQVWIPPSLGGPLLLTTPL